MRALYRSFVPLLLGYVLLVGLSIFLAWARLESEVRRTASETAKLVASEIAVALGESDASEIDRSSLKRMALLERLFTLVDRSVAVEAAAYVGEDGRVQISSELEEVGREFPVGSFDGPELRVLDLPAGRFAPRAYVAEVPVFLEGGALDGFFRIRLRTATFAPFYRQAYQQVFLMAALGLSALGAAVFVIHLQLRSEERHLLALLTSGEPPESASKSPSGELNAVHREAHRIVHELADEREARSQDRRVWSEALGRLETGIVILQPGRAELWNERATELLGVRLPTAWSAVAEELSRRVDRGDRRLEKGCLEDHGAGPDRRLEVEVQATSDRTVVVLREEAALRALENDLRDATRLRNLSRVFLGAAHDLRAPLNAMVLNLQLARRRAARAEMEEAEKLDEDLTIVEKEMGRLQRMVERLLSQTRTEADAPERVDVSDVVRDVVSLLEPTARTQSTRLVASPLELPAVVRLRRDHLQQVLLNLAMNGLEALESGGRLEIGVEARGAHVAVEVRDDGPGIPAEVMPRLFDLRFTTKPGGSGVGLYVARSLVEGAGGGIEVESDAEGTRFRLLLPVVPEGAEEEARASEG